MVRRSGSFFISERSSRPSMRGMLRSKRTKSGRGVPVNLPRLRKYSKASMPSLAKFNVLRILPFSSAFLAIKMSPRSSSTSKMSIGRRKGGLTVPLIAGFSFNCGGEEVARFKGGEAEVAPGAFGGLDPNLATGSFDHTLAHGEPNTGARVFVAGVESLKDHE